MKECSGRKRMDNFIDKLAQKFTAGEVIRANQAAEEQELRRLRQQVAEYENCLQEMRKLQLLNTETAESMKQLQACNTEAAESMRHWLRSILASSSWQPSHSQGSTDQI